MFKLYENYFLDYFYCKCLVVICCRQKQRSPVLRLIISPAHYSHSSRLKWRLVHHSQSNRLKGRLAHHNHVNRQKGGLHPQPQQQARAMYLHATATTADQAQGLHTTANRRLTTWPMLQSSSGQARKEATLKIFLKGPFKLPLKWVSYPGSLWSMSSLIRFLAEI